MIYHYNSIFLAQFLRMELLNGVKCLELLKEIDLVGFSKILHHINEIFETNDSNFKQPILNFDVNYLFINKTKSVNSIKIKVKKILAMLLAFSKCGFIYNLIADLDYRRHSKLVLLKQELDQEMNNPDLEE